MTTVSRPAEDNVLSVRDLHLSFESMGAMRSVLAIDELCMRRGETLGLIGESGSGKSVLALAILGLLATPPAVYGAESRIALDGDDLLGKPQSEMRMIRGRRIAMIFQDPMSTLNPVFRVGSQLTRVIRQMDGLRKSAAHERAINLLESVELPDAAEILKAYPHQLSGGQRQRVIIALAVACHPELIIADEPTRNLDVTIQAGVLKLLAAQKRKLGVSVLFIANNLGLVSAVCDRAAVLMNGRVVELGTVEEITRHAAHPYTALLRDVALPATAGEAAVGGVASRTRGDGQTGSGEGCTFADSCARRTTSCRSTVPSLRSIGETHLVACHAAAPRESR